MWHFIIYGILVSHTGSTEVPKGLQKLPGSVDHFVSNLSLELWGSRLQLPPMSDSVNRTVASRLSINASLLVLS